MHRHRVLPAAALGLCALIASCGTDAGPTPTPEHPIIAPGVGIGPISLGMSYGDLAARYGEMTNAIVDGRVAIGGYPAEGLDFVLTSPDPTALTPDAVVVAVGVKSGTWAGSPRPGLTRAEVEAALGPAAYQADTIEYYPSGVSVTYEAGAAGDTARAVGVFPPFTHAPTPPEMEPAKTWGGGQ